mmetsp:Transcript_14278/g.27410  ORF Transcript_14278/g.27410 Transcript_14278/m.27410 type:complete len:425 (-) Transcript_14278:234-1508(-)
MGQSVNDGVSSEEDKYVLPNEAQSGHRKRKRTKQSKNTVRSPRSSTGAVVASVTASCHQMQTRAHKMHGEQPLHNDTCLVPLTRITLSVLDPIIPKEFQTFSESEHEPMLPGFSLAQTICSYGYFQLSPNVWVPAADNEHEDQGLFCRPLVATSCITEESATEVFFMVLQQPKNCSMVCIHVFSHQPVTELHRSEARRAARRILRLDQSFAGWWDRHPEAAARGFGRTFRSPTVFEDMVKTITNCNIKFQGTIRMNRLLCEEFGPSKRAFPQPCDLHHLSVDELRVKAKVGYRAERIIRLAKSFVQGELTEDWFDNESVPTEEMYARVLKLYGFGSFAASNVMQLLGRHNTLVEPFDSETVRLMKELGVARSSQNEYFAAARHRYQAYSPYQFLAYWFELWKNYEERAGMVSTRWTVEKFNIFL